MLVSAAVAANLLPAALLFYFVHRFGVDVPFLDEWDCFVPVLRQFHQGTLGFPGLFAQQNEHRMVFPRLLTLANAMLFHWNRTAEMYVTAVLLILCAWLLYRFVQRYWAHPLTPLLFLPIAWTLLSWRQSGNLLEGVGTAFALLEAGTVLAFLLLHRTRGADRFVSGAAASAFVASFSSGGGLLVWPVGLAQLLLQRLCEEPDRRPGAGAFVVWTGAGSLTWALFFFGYRYPAVDRPTGFGYMIHHPVAAAGYVAAMIGSPLSDRPFIAQALGVIMTALSVWAVFRLRRAPRDLAAAAPLLAFLAFVLLTAAAACDRRLSMGIEQALASRYCGLTALGLVASYALWTRFALSERRLATSLACAGMAALLLLGSMAKFTPWIHDPPGRAESFALAAYALRYPGLVGDEAIFVLHPRPDVVRERTRFLRARGYSLFHQAVPIDLPARYDGSMGGCNIEAVNGRWGPVIDVHRPSEMAGLRVTGWAADLGKGQEPSRLFVSIDGHIDVPAVYGQARPDVGRALGNPNYGASAFISDIRPSLVADGEHTVELKIVNHDGTGYWTCGAARIRVAE